METPKIEWSTNRGPEVYDSILGDTFYDDIQGENILEIGPGKDELFAKKCAAKGAKMFLLNPYRLTSGKVFSRTNKSKYPAENQPTHEAGYAQFAPFKSDHFKKIVAFYSVPYYLADEESVHRTFEHVIRMLKPGGTAHFFPAVFPDGYDAEYLAWLRSKPDIIVDFSARPTAFGPRPYLVIHKNAVTSAS